MDDTAVPIGGEAFAALTVLFVAGMLLIVLWRAVAKTRAARGVSRGASRRRRAEDGGAYPFVAEGGSRKTDSDASDGENGGGD